MPVACRGRWWGWTTSQRSRSALKQSPTCEDDLLLAMEAPRNLLQACARPSTCPHWGQWTREWLLPMQAQASVTERRRADLKPGCPCFSPDEAMRIPWGCTTPLSCEIMGSHWGNLRSHLNSQAGGSESQGSHESQRQDCFPGCNVSGSARPESWGSRETLPVHILHPWPSGHSWESTGSCIWLGCFTWLCSALCRLRDLS